MENKRNRELVNEELLELTKQAFEKDEVVEFLQGFPPYTCPVNRFVPANVPTDFERITRMAIYEYYKQTKNQKIIEKMKNALLELFEGDAVQIWIAYTMCWTQIYFEKKGIAPFHLADQELLDNVKSVLLRNKEELCLCKEWQGHARKNGLWDNINGMNNVMREKYGVDML